MRYLLFSLLLVSLLCRAEIYSTIDNRGNITYSDIPNKNAKTVIVQPNIDIVTDKKSPQSESEPSQTIGKNKELKQVQYDTFVIISPKEQETIQNQASFPVEISLVPELQPQNKIQLLVDGKPVGEAVSSPRLQASILERGTHTLAAVIIDENNVILQKSNQVTIFVHRNSIQTSPASF